MVRAHLQNKARLVFYSVIINQDCRVIRFLAGLITVNFMPYLNTLTKPVVITDYKMDLHRNPSHFHFAFFLVAPKPYCDECYCGVQCERGLLLAFRLLC